MEWDRGIIAKLERALALRDDLQAEQARLRGDGQDQREYDSVSNDTDETDRMVWREWRLTQAPDPLPLSFAALLGDVIQNLRAALDYTAWAAASDNARQQHQTQVYFPLLKKQRDFTKWVRDRSGRFSEDTVKAMEWAQPYQAAKDHLHPLRILRVLSNTDKHRLLNVVDHAHIDQGIVMLPEPPVYDFWSAEGPVRAGELLARLEFPRPPFKLAIDVMPIFGWYESVAYEEPGQDVRWLRIDELMNALCSFTVDAVGLMSGARLGLKPEDVDDVSRDETPATRCSLDHP